MLRPPPPQRKRKPKEATKQASKQASKQTNKNRTSKQPTKQASKQATKSRKQANKSKHILKHTNKNIDRQTSKQTDKQTHRPTHKQTSKQTNKRLQNSSSRILVVPRTKPFNAPVDEHISRKALDMFQNLLLRVFNARVARCKWSPRICFVVLAVKSRAEAMVLEPILELKSNTKLFNFSTCELWPVPTSVCFWIHALKGKPSPPPKKKRRRRRSNK